MNTNDITSIDDIDAMLDKEYKIDNIQEDNNSDDVNENTDGETESEDNNDAELNDETQGEGSEDENKETDETDEPQVDENEKVEKPSKEDKKEYAFQTLRKERDNLKREKAELEGYSEFVKNLAHSYGYTDVDKFQKDLKAAQLAKEAKSKGVDVDSYRKIAEQEERIAQLERERDDEILQRKAQRFKNALDLAVKDYNLTEDEIFEKLENAGVEFDTIINIPNPRVVIDGVLIDTIKDNAKQSQIENMERTKKFSESKNENGGTGKSTITIDSILKEEMKKLKADNFL